MIDRATASRLGISASQIDNTLYDAFGQRQVSTIYSAQNQYHVIMEVEPRYWQTPETLKDIYVSTAGRHGKRHANDQFGGRHCFGPNRQQPGQHGEQCNDRRRHRQQFGAQRIEQRIGQHRQGQCIVRRRRQHQPRKRWCRWPLSPISVPAARRWRSITRARLSPPRFRSTSHPANRSAMPRSR